MIYPAPRQGLFAIIILVSISLTLLFFVVSQERNLSAAYQTLGEQKTLFLAEEMKAPLSAVDRVGMSVIANHYLKDGMISFVAVYDSDNNLLIPTGKESLDGFVNKETITLGNQVLGFVEVHTHAVSRAKIIADNWLFLLAVLILHAFIWLLYGYVARPTKELQQQITEDVRQRLLNTGILSPHLQSSPKIEIPSTESVQSFTKQSTSLPDEKKPHTSSTQVPNNPDLLVIQVCFEDRNLLLDTIGYHAKSAYFALCDQLLRLAVDELLNLPVLSGVSLHSLTPYTHKGAAVYLSANNSHAKAALASVMLAKLMMLLHQVVYDKHRELKRFCLPVRTLVSTLPQMDNIIMVAKRHLESPLVLLPEKELLKLATYVELGKLLDPISVSERECRHLKKVNEATSDRLQKVRDKVLLSD